jgi:hypothetical protein
MANKKVLDSRVLDSMEDLYTWSFTGAGEMTLTGVHIKDGRRSLLIGSPLQRGQIILPAKKLPGLPAVHHQCQAVSYLRQNSTSLNMPSNPVRD